MQLENIRTGVPADSPTAGPAAGWILSVLRRLRQGRLDVTLPGGETQAIVGEEPGPQGELVLHRPVRLALRLLARGDLGLGEGFVAGDWDARRPADTLGVLALNETAFRVARGRLARLADRLQHRWRRNDRRGSRRNVAAHYDLGNDFYRLWLDPGMTYSAALFAEPGEPLEQAQGRKYDAVLDRLGARPGEHVLEIGCGWGGLAERAARRGLRVTGVTLSHAQLEYARARLEAAGLADRVELRLQDYRDIAETFDHVVSIEMFEAVGEAYWPAYFAALRRCLRPGGRASLQVITIAEDAFDAYRRDADFIQKHVFPGGMLPAVSAFDAAAADAGLVVAERSFHGTDYADTLRRWDAAFRAREAQIDALGYDARFRRLWRYYLAYCEAGFRTGRIDLMQVGLTRADA
ncbi:MAG: cyclopropane-fatty-acyl-phospholipid synthase family protein [Gammaproteobacteria bacterium]|nr:cyclopropane-fatty-acyl-phospholipid synthase family protein [Gammaproteobacteria bacterium]